jgi:hypothetical protein
MKNLNYDDSLRQPRARRNLSSHQYPADRRPPTPVAASVNNPIAGLQVLVPNGNAATMDLCHLEDNISNLKEQLRVMEQMLSTNVVAATENDQLDDVQLDVHQSDDDTDDPSEDPSGKYILPPFKVYTSKKSGTLRSLSTPAIKKKRKSSQSDDEDWHEDNRITKTAKSTRISSCSDSSLKGGDDDDDEQMLPNSRLPKSNEHSSKTKSATHRRLVHEKQKLTTPSASSNEPKTKKSKDRVTNDRCVGKVSAKTLVSDVDNISTEKKKKGIPKTKKPSSKADKDNYDDPDKWDVVPDTDRECTEQKRKLNKVQLKVESVVNHRKGKNFRGELLVLYTTGQRDWCYLHGALQDAPTIVLQYMASTGIDYPHMGYNDLDPDLLNPDTDSPFIFFPADEVDDNIEEKQAFIPIDNTEQHDTENNTEGADGTNTHATLNVADNEKDFQDDALMIASALVDCGMVSQHVSDSFSSDLLSCADIAAKETNNTGLDIIATTSETTPAKDLASTDNPGDNEPETSCNCSYDHSDYHQLVPESDSRYCFKGRDFDGVHCAIATCNKLFVHSAKGKTDCFKPTDKHPLYACKNRREKCPFAICFQCHNNYLLNYVRK